MAQYMWNQSAAPTGSSWISPAYQQNSRPFGLSHEPSSSMRQKPSRVMKPTSAGNSPRRNGRRTMILQNQLPSQAPTRNGRFEDSLYPALLAAASEQRARPISWHPPSAQVPNMVSQSQTNTSLQVPSYANVPTRTFNDPSGNVNVSMAPLSHPNPSCDLFPQPPNGYQTYPASSSPSQSHQMGHANHHPNIWPTEPIDPSYYPIPLQQPHHGLSPYSHPSPQPSFGYGLPERGDAAYYSSRSSAASLTPDILPIQKFDDEPPTPPTLPQRSDPLGDELVGMGLYDEPESPSYDPEHEFMMRADGTVVPVPRPAGKGLKLEETFVPSSTDGGEESSGESERDERSAIPNNQQQSHAREDVQVVPGDNSGRWFSHLNGDQKSMPTIAGSFLFDDEDTVESDYLKPMMFPTNMYANSNTSTPGYGWM
ncbi:hypothetical protein FQN54_006918 [Arachnomyces sp. PD_36]|nr:hypothetical protein FQN54_006918 [Arachnomyces sp. PD_36]